MRPPPPPGGDQDRAANLLAARFVASPIIILILLARFIVRYKRRYLGADDYLMFLTGVLLIAALPFGVLYLTNGGARHAYYLTPQQLSNIVKYNSVSQTMGAFEAMFSKMSVSCLVLRLFGPHTTWRKWTVYALLAIYIPSTIAVPVAFYGRCRPARAAWEKVPGASCWKEINTEVGIAQSVIGTVLDFTLAFIPATVILRLQKSKTEKIWLSVLLGLGIVPGICSAVKVSIMEESLSWNDPTWQSYDLYIWSMMEIYLIVILGSVPSIKPLYDKVRHGKPISEAGVSGQVGQSSKTSFRLRSLLHSANRQNRMGSAPSEDSAVGREYQRDAYATSSTKEDEVDLKDRTEGNGKHIVVETAFDFESQSLPGSIRASEQQPTNTREGL